MVEAALLLLFDLAGANLQSFAPLLVPSTVLLLCFVIGLQNAIFTKVSGAEICTTHMTGIATDIGIEVGHLICWNRDATANSIHIVRVNRGKLFIHLAILGLFFGGGSAGALAFRFMGFAATVPVACALAALALPPILIFASTASAAGRHPAHDHAACAVAYRPDAPDLQRFRRDSA